jgi:hypothetical protein
MTPSWSLPYFILLFFCTPFSLSDNKFPFVVLPSVLRWAADNEIYVTPLLQQHTPTRIRVDISAQLNGAKYTAFTQSFDGFPGKTTKIVAPIRQESPSGSYDVRISVTGHNDFLATIANGPNVRQIYVQTDKFYYSPKEKVNIRLLPLTYDGAVYGGNIDLSLINPNGFRIFNTTVNAKGRFVASFFELPRFLQLGDWKVVAKAVGAQREKFSTSIRVQEYVMPKYHVILRVNASNETLYTVFAMVHAKFAHGLPVSGDINLRCALASNRENATLNGHAPPPSQKKLVTAQGKLRR